MHKFPLVCLLVVPLTGCLSKNVNMYPVSGPLVSSGVIRIKATGLEGASGTLTATLPGGASCSGNWASTVSTANRFFGAYSWKPDNGFSTRLTQKVGVQSGMNPGQAFLNCTDGTVIEINFVTGAAKGGYGEASDNRGNVYRVII